MGIKIVSSGANSGDIKPHAGAVIPAGWLECGGQAVSRATYSALFLAIGVLYGAGDGVNTFNLPDLRGRTLFGRDNLGGAAANRLTTGNGGVNGVALGAVGGAEAVTLSEAQMPSHAHSFNNLANQWGAANSNPTGGNGNVSGSPVTNAKGANNAHVNIPPAMVINYIIKT